MLLLISIATLAFNVQPAKAEPKTWIVDDDGPADFSKIQDAVNAANPGDLILVKAGTYYENVVVDKNNLTISGENPVTTIIDGEGLGNVTYVTGNNIAIQNFTLKNSAKWAWSGALYVENANNTIIQNNSIINNRFGIYLENSSNNTISGNYLTNNDESIFLVNSSNNTIYGNDLISNIHAIDLRFSSINIISKNNLTNNTGVGIYLSDSSSNNIISNNNITNHNQGIVIYAISSDNTIIGNNIINNGFSGIALHDSNNNAISGNNITRSLYGIHVGGSSNVFSGNMLSDNKYNFEVIGDLWSDWASNLASHSIDTTNLVNGKPVYYIVNQKDFVISPATHPKVGYLALINCINITVENLTLTSNGEGLLLSNTNCSKMMDNNVTNNGYGIVLVNSSDNVVPRNNIINNQRGLSILYSGENNAVYHNNFVNNTSQVYLFWLDSVNVWDDGYPSGGNYWSDYTGVDLYSGPYQNITGSDGIGDIPYSFGDRYPLMNLWPSGPGLHELEVTLKAPTSLWLGNSTLIEATVTNRGINDEQNVDFSIYINNIAVNSTTITSLKAGSSYTINYLWNPTFQGTYNVTTYARPVLGEILVQNNRLTNFATVSNPPTPPEVQVGVKTGDWIKIEYTITGWPAGTPYPLWLKVEFLSVEGTSATVRVTMRMSNGTEQNATVPVDVVAGGQAFGLSGFVIPANLTSGDIIFMSGYGNVTIAGETTRTYAGASRTVVYASFSQYGTQLTYYWDKQTGVMVEASTTSGTMTGTGKATETNIWEATPSFPFDSIILSVLIAIVIVIVVAIFLVRRKEKPPEAQKPAI
jgi:parallel beta-helix repeat protein